MPDAYRDVLHPRSKAYVHRIFAVRIPFIASILILIPIPTLSFPQLRLLLLLISSPPIQSPSCERM
jgi:hypothetical protein